MGPSRLTRAGLMVGAVAAMFACAEPTSSPSNLRNTLSPSLGVFLPSGGTANTAEAERIEVCKNYVMTSGAQPPALTNFTVNGPGTVNGVFSLAPNTCREVWVGHNESVTITEETLTGFTQECLRTLLNASTAACTSGTEATSYVSGTAGAQAGEVVVFTNTEIEQEDGCTYTQGYWKTHSSYGPAGPEDDGWANVGGPDAAFFGSGKTWIEMFNTPVKGSQYVQLAHQYMAAKLNVLNGASAPANVLQALADAEAYFNGGAYPTGAHSILGQFNEGLIGPGHCDETTIS